VKLDELEVHALGFQFLQIQQKISLEEEKEDGGDDDEDQVRSY
jgi:hypothetical protein